MTCTEKAEQILQRCLQGAPFVAHRWQIDALDAYLRLGGLFCAMPPGRGKSLVAAAASTLAQRCVVVTPAAVRRQTASMFRDYGATQSTFISYNEISRDPDLLDKLAPDLLILDEAHRLKNVATAAWSRRVARYLAAKPLCQVMVLSGSIMHKSVLDYAHMLVWSLRQYAPVPRSRSAWQRLALDVERDPQAWLAKLRSTPGLFIDEAPSWAGTLTLSEHWPELLLPEALDRAETRGVAPDGWACTEGWAVEELTKQLACGFYLRRDPRPSPALLDARRLWARCVDNARAYGLADTDVGARTHYPQAYAQWEAAQAAEPEGAPVPEWLAEPYVPAVQPGTIVWLHHTALAERLAQITGWPFHHERGLDARGVRLDETDAPVVLASMKACSEGFNAQLRFNRNVVLEPQPDARLWQQMLCRTARQGQPAAEVTCEIIVLAPIYGRALDAARRGARKIEIETGQRQLLSQAEG